MGAQPREVKVLTALSVSMTLGFLVLMALGNNPPSAGAFCLSSYYRLEPVNSIINQPANTEIQTWKRIKVTYINMPLVYKNKSHNNKANALNQETSPLTTESSQTDQPRGHFFVCDGIIGPNGDILPTQKWFNQENLDKSNESTIYISVITGGHGNGPTGIQIERTGELVVSLSKRFNIPPKFILY